jgi:hypothetical protein
MNQELFRKSAIERVTSPDQLNDTIKVVPTGIWLALGAVALAMVAMVVFLSMTDVNLVGLIFG